MTEAPPEPDNSGHQQRQGGRFQAGQSGNPAGRTKGSRNRATVVLDQIGEEFGANVLRRVIVAASRGDMAAAEIVLRRVWPVPKSRRVKVKLPPLRTASDGVAALAMLAAAAAKGDLALDEAAELARLIEAHSRAVVATDLEARIVMLEAAASGGKP